GGNAGPLQRATAQLKSEDRDVRVFTTSWDGDAHAGCVETSIQLTLQPERVHMADAVLGNTRPLRELMGALRAKGMRAVSESGILGDPLSATAREGAMLLDQLTADLLAELLSWQSEGDVS
ncbi:MAG: creatininase family protein, partial [Acidimicrobiales bacterium]